jgi:DNA-binding NarL/FixJ family response regulator
LSATATGLHTDGRDQKDNTARVLRLGAGVQIGKRSTPDRIAAAVAEVLGRGQYRAAARRFADVLGREATSRPNGADEAQAMLTGTGRCRSAREMAHAFGMEVDLTLGPVAA